MPTNLHCALAPVKIKCLELAQKMDFFDTSQLGVMNVMILQSGMVKCDYFLTLGSQVRVKAPWIFMSFGLFCIIFSACIGFREGEEVIHGPL